MPRTVAVADTATCPAFTVNGGGADVFFAIVVVATVMFDGCVPGASIVIMAAVVVSIVVMTVVADTESVFVFNFFADWVCLNDR